MTGLSPDTVSDGGRGGMIGIARASGLGGELGLRGCGGAGRCALGDALIGLTSSAVCKDDGRAGSVGGADVEMLGAGLDRRGGGGTGLSFGAGESFAAVSEERGVALGGGAPIEDAGAGEASGEGRESMFGMPEVRRDGGCEDAGEAGIEKLAGADACGCLSSSPTRSLVPDRLKYVGVALSLRGAGIGGGRRVRFVVGLLSSGGTGG